MAIAGPLPKAKQSIASTGFQPHVSNGSTHAVIQLKGSGLPGNDGEPMENERERFQGNLGLAALDQLWQDREDFYCGSNMFVYYSEQQVQDVLAELADPSLPKRAFRGPDLFVALGVDGRHRRQKWVVWEEEGRYPNVIFEFLSPSTRAVDMGKKKDLYEQTFKTPEYFCFDYMSPDQEQSLIGFRLDGDGRYQPIQPNEHGWLWSEQLALWVGKWHGTFMRDATTWLRFYTPAGELVLTGQEAETVARQAAEAENARLRAELEQFRRQASGRQ